MLASEIGANNRPLSKTIGLPPQWYAVYTCVHREKRIAQLLHERGVDYFLPLYEEVHNWKTGPAQLQLPLFPGYVFVHIVLAERLRVLTIPGVVRLVGSGNTPSALPEEEIHAIRSALAASLRTTPYPYLALGQEVRIIRGPLCGLQGILRRQKSRTRVILSLEAILRSVAVDIEASDCVPVRAPVLRAVRERACLAAAPA